MALVALVMGAAAAKRPAAIDQYLLLIGPIAANPQQQSAVSEWDRRMDGPGPDLSVRRPWAGSLLEAPILTLNCYNLHALTIGIITKYTCICIYFYAL